MLYKKRRKVELFFKWLKQHLRIKSFWGTTLNAVKVQIYCLVAKAVNKLKVDSSICEILQIPSISLSGKTPVREALTKCTCRNIKEIKNNQFIISAFKVGTNFFSNAKITIRLQKH